tara:strand:- start:170 stop:343 length:174 start_codon:yes stop_codon:yes gene_type:complete
VDVDSVEVGVPNRDWGPLPPMKEASVMDGWDSAKSSRTNDAVWGRGGGAFRVEREEE